MQTIPTAAGGCIIHRKVQVITTEKPVEGAAGFDMPAFVPGDTMCRETGRHHGLRLDRLLVETRTFAIFWVKAIGTDRDKMPALGIRVL